MLNLRLYVCLMLAILVSDPALAKNETLAERGMRMCEEAGIPLEDCKMLPPVLRGADPNANVAATTPDTLPMNGLGPGPAAFGTGRYGWCEGCTSLLAAAPVTPWAAYGGRQFQPHRDEDEGRPSAGGTSIAGSLGDGAEADDGSEAVNGGAGNGDTSDGEGGDGDSDENGGGNDTGGGPFCE